MSFIPFDEVKEAVSITDAVSKLGLNLKPSGKALRGDCPNCGGNRTLVVTPDRNVWYCFEAKEGGDQISLVAHIKGIPVKEAAQFLFTVPQEKDEAKQAPKTLQPLPHLEFDHPAVEALGLDTAVAEALGIGYAPKGVAKGNVVIPIRDEQGTLKGYLGVQELTFIPKDFLPSNVVKLRA